jgi:hypothetical protein
MRPLSATEAGGILVPGLTVDLFVQATYVAISKARALTCLPCAYL